MNHLSWRGFLHLYFFLYSQFLYRSFIGYTSINSVLSEVRDLKLAARSPLAMITVAAVYFFIIISYHDYAVVAKTDILESNE